MRICLVYDCLFPWTVGGAERWYRNLGERLAAEGHDVTYLTRLQWDDADPPSIPGIRVLAVSPADDLYGPDGNRRIVPPLRFGRGVLRHLWRHGGGYDVVHTASFPYFSLLAAGLARRRHRFGLVVDWHEVWSRAYWREYLGPAGGAVGHAVQRACIRVPQRAFCFSRLHRDRLVEEGLRSTPAILEGEFAGDLTPPEPNDARPLVVFAGRHIREKRAPAVPPAVAAARRHAPEIEGVIFGDGPERPQVEEAVRTAEVQEAVEVRGFVDHADLERALRTATCLLLPSSREGYGMVVVEASAQGTPSIVVRSEDNAAVELVEDGVNGVVADSADPQELARAILRVHAAGRAMRESTCAWFAANARRLSLEHSLAAVAGAYARWASARR
jgi:glycosyltransferase involved in cell wall biosynthesis